MFFYTSSKVCKNAHYSKNRVYTILLWMSSSVLYKAHHKKVVPPGSPGADSENLDFVAPLAEHGFMVYFVSLVHHHSSHYPFQNVSERPFEDHFLQSVTVLC